jgi:hypothetical protein
MIGKFVLGALAALGFSTAVLAQDATLAAPASPWDRIHTVAIVSGIGTALQLRSDNSLSSDIKQVDIRDWNIDPQVTAALKQYLAGRFKFADVKYDPAAVAQIPSGDWDNFDHATRAFDNTLAADGIDAFIVVRPNADKSVSGQAGLVLEDRHSADPRPVEWAGYSIDIVDAKTFQLIAHAQSALQLRASAPPTVAARMGAADLNPGETLAITDAQRAVLQADYTRLVSQSLIEAVRALNLNVPLPDVGSRNLVAFVPGQDPFASIKTVAIASAIGDELSLKQWSVITLTEKQIAIGDWHLDDQIESMAKDAMGKRFTIVAGNIDRAALETGTPIDSRGHIPDIFPGLTPANDIDAYVVFIKMPLADEAGGIGMYTNNALVGANETDLFANYAVAVIDAHTLKPIKVVRATTGPKASASTPTRTVDGAMWPASLTALTPEEAAKIHQAASDILADSVPETLLRMGLTGMTIGGAPSQPPTP